METRGRKALPRAERKSDRVWVGVLPAEGVAIRRAARIAKLSPSDWARRVLYTEALRVAAPQTDAPAVAQ